MYYNGNNAAQHHPQGMYKNASAGAYTGSMTAGGSTIEGVLLSKDHLNESSNYLSDHAANNDPLMKSNQ
jgi:hypothetical protein